MSSCLDHGTSQDRPVFVLEAAFQWTDSYNRYKTPTCLYVYYKTRLPCVWMMFLLLCMGKKKTTLTHG